MCKETPGNKLGKLIDLGLRSKTENIKWSICQINYKAETCHVKVFGWGFLSLYEKRNSRPLTLVVGEIFFFLRLFILMF